MSHPWTAQNWNYYTPQRITNPMSGQKCKLDELCLMSSTANIESLDKLATLMDKRH